VLAAALAAGCGGAPAGPRRAPAAAGAPERQAGTPERQVAGARANRCVAVPRDLARPGPFAVRRVRVALARRSAITGPRRPIDPVLWLPRGRCRRPLVLFSHGHFGDPLSCSRLCGHLATLGFAVLGIRHADRATPAALQGPERVEDLTYALDHRVWRRLAPGLRVDARHVGVAGHSFGGRTAAELAAQDLRVAALVTMAGGADRATTALVHAPTLMLAGSADTIDPPRLSEASIRALSRTTPHRLLVVRGADHGALVDGCAAARTCAEIARAVSAHFIGALARRPP
jgi:dienelactone hydrolase